jgi:F-type H+-transporting ATPase subunit epsilon
MPFGKTFALEIHTPNRLFFEGDAEEIIISLPDGECGILPGHTRFASPVVPCIVKIKCEGEGDGKGRSVWKNAFVAGGIIEVKMHKTVVLGDSAEWPSEIDTKSAELAKSAAEEILNNPASGAREREQAGGRLKKSVLRLILASL